MQPNELDTLTTFTLEACKRLAEVLGEDSPKTYWVWGTNNRGKFLYEPVPHNEIKYAGWVYAYRLDDLDGATWKKIGERMGWDEQNPFAREWVKEPREMYLTWLTRGYPEASKYLIDILQGYGKG